MKVLCENNPDLLLQEFESKGNGIRIAINFYNYPDNKIIETAAYVLMLYCKYGFVQEVN